VENDALLKEEKEFLQRILLVFNNYRTGLLHNVVGGRNIAVEEEKKQNKITEQKDINNDNNLTLIRFLHAVPSFVGKELEVYGPFEEEDMAHLPREIAELLIKKGRAEEINQG